MQFSELWTSRLDEELGNSDSTQLFTDARRQFAINEGIRQFADLTECYVKESTVSCSHAIGEYNLLSSVNVPSTDFSRLSLQQPEFAFTDSNARTTYRSGEDFRRVTVEELNEREPGWRGSTGGTPYCYYERMDGGRRLLGLYPPPEIGSSETARVRLPYCAQPPTLSASTDVPFTDSNGTRTDLAPYHMAFVHYAAYQLNKLRVEHEEGTDQLQAFGGYVQRWLAYLRPRGGTAVKSARQYFRDSRRSGGGGLNPWPTDQWGNR